jgi:NAD(P) transhydrogenase subunit alpha
VLVTAGMVGGMTPGSVVIDLAAERGGNCALTRPDEVVVHKGVTIVGPSNPPALVPNHASQMYARNVASFLSHVARDGRLNLDFSDEIIRETCVTHGGEVRKP